MLLLQNFELALKSIPFTNYFKLEAPSYSGEIRKVKLENGFYAYSWEIDVKEDHRFIHAHQPGQEHYHLLVLNLETKPHEIVLESKRKYRFNSETHCFLYMDSKAKTEFVFKKGDKIRCLAIRFTQEWLDAQLRLSSENIESIKRSLNNLVGTSFGKLTDHQVVLANQVQKSFSSNDSVLLIKSETYKLISLFVNLEKNISREKQSDAELMYEVQERILKCLHTSLPSINDLAKEFFTSPSTLKRHFRSCFGQSIYDYYLTQKMELGKKMLTEQHMNVSETATELGYESASHFSTLFTRHFGNHPAQFKKGN